MSDLVNADEYVKDVISHDEALEMVHRMIHSHFRRTDAEHMRASIPANPKRDDDLRLIAYVKQRKMADTHTQDVTDPDEPRTEKGTAAQKTIAAHTEDPDCPQCNIPVAVIEGVQSCEC